MINKDYRDSALKVYGEACEICGYRAGVEVHHIDYQEQWEIEKKLRKAKGSEYTRLLAEAKKQGYDEFKDNQLAKNDSTKNLSVLCGNHHSLIHSLDSGKALLKVIPERK
ncbi:HNH endonuclease [Neobacillus driksii]|uniref:HNH endonuclease n=1 Tax=Neobacillus driksii TaxID=3035913 RepID=UPI0027D87866|nr:HNH endonuclease [Neobacillus niacini]